MEVQIELKLTNYIAHPFWPARNRVIEIEKKSGCNRLKVAEKRLAAIKAECANQGFTYEQYLGFIEEAKDQWYRSADKKTVVIPRHQIAGAIVQAVAGAPRAVAGPFNKDNFRALVQIGDFVTDRTKADGVFSRFVKLDGSNQRSFQENEYIGRYLDAGEPFTATGMIVLADVKHGDFAKGLFTKVVQEIGIGAARKMGFGRGVVKTWEV